jgi:N-acetylglutamate synthase-like GNAT family acetyltransferase
MSVSVREAMPDDVEAVGDVARDAWYAAYGGFLDPRTIKRGLAENYDPDLVEAGIDHEEIAFFVAEADGKVVGYASAEQTWADEAELHTLYVHPDRWGEGVGRALFERVEAWARQRDIDRVAAAALSENAVATQFFEALGFEAGLEARTELAGELHPEVEYELEL